MKKLILKCILLLLMAGSVLCAGGAAYRRTNTYRNLERTEETEKFHELPDAVDIAVFGSSHGRDAFKYPPEGRSFFNFSLSSQTPQYDAAMLRQFQDRLEPGALVILTVSYSSPYWTDSEDAFERKQPRYYRVLSPENIVDVDLARYWLERFSPLLTLEPTDIAAAFLKKPELIKDSEDPAAHKELTAGALPDERARIERDHWGAVSPVYPEVNPVMWGAYHEMLDLCREREWNAVLVTPPYPAAYSGCFPEGFYGEFRRRMEALAAEYDIAYLDYSHDPDFAERYDLYKNIDHLNLDGAAVFDRRFFADIRDLLD